MPPAMESLHPMEPVQRPSVQASLGASRDQGGPGLVAQGRPMGGESGVTPQGWGAHSGNQMLKGIWSQEDKQDHINVLEMRAVTKTLQGFNIPPYSHILASTDNTTVAAYVNKEGGTWSLPLWRETQSLFGIVASINCSIWAVHIPGRLNFIADMLSRQDQASPRSGPSFPA